MNCAKEKASKMLKELEELGLIWRVTQIGHASIIYVKNFVADTGEVPEDLFENRTGSENELVDERPMEDERTSTEIVPVRNNDRFDNQTGSGSEIEH